MAGSIVPDLIWKWVYSVLDDVSDEAGVERKGPWLLAYEGWGGFGVSPVWDPARPVEENEDAAYAYAADESGVIIDEWIERFSATYDLAESGHEPTGLYGVTWALFIHKGSPVAQIADGWPLLLCGLKLRCAGDSQESANHN